MALPVVTTEIAFGSNPGDSSYSWTDVSAYVRQSRYTRGKQQELNRPDAGSGTHLLRDETRRFDPSNTASPYYPDVLPLVPMRGKAVINAHTYYLYQHYVERWPLRRHGPNYAERELTTIDGFALLQAAQIDPAKATLSTTLGGNADLKYTAEMPGTGGNNITVTYIQQSGTQIGGLRVIGNDITFLFSAVSPTTASGLLTILQNDSNANKLCDFALASGSNGSGNITALATTHLAGGSAAAFSQELSGTRIGNLLDAAAWPSALRTLAAGKSTLPAITYTIGESTPIFEELLSVAGEQAESGFVFIDGQGNFVFLDRHTQITTPYTTSQATFSDTPGVGEYGYHDIVPSYDVDQIINEWSGTRDGGTTQIAGDTTSQDQYLRRPRQVNVLLTSDNDVLAIMQWRLAQFKDPLNRVASITVKPGRDTATWEAVLGLEPGDRITVKEHPVGGGSAINRDYNVQRLNVTLTPGLVDSTFEFGLWPADVNTWLILNDSVYGKLDSNKVAA